MKISRLSASRLAPCVAILCGLSLSPSVYAQPKMGRPKNGKTAAKNRDARGKKLTPRMIKAIEAQTGQPLTPQTKAQLNTALRAREAAIQAANDAFYAQMAQATGLTVQQAQDIDKPKRNKSGAPAAPLAPIANPNPMVPAPTNTVGAEAPAPDQK